MTDEVLDWRFSCCCVPGLAGALRSARAADEWFVLGEKTLKTVDPSTEIKAQGNRRQRNVNQVKLSAEGADVQIDKADRSARRELQVVDVAQPRPEGSVHASSRTSK